MGLRLLKGIDLADFQARSGRDLATEKAGQLRKLGELGLLELEQNTLRLSRNALFVSNSVIGELL
jgi:coproporphyrinogen III oxidase-like Fe-S oxidoreductase